MEEAKKGSPGKKTPTKWSWGNNHIIEKPPVKKTKVSCLVCRYYEEKDKSCLIKPIGPGDGIEHWKKCKDFIIDIGYDTNTNREVIAQVKGITFVKQMIQKIEQDKTKEPAQPNGLTVDPLSNSTGNDKLEKPQVSNTFSEKPKVELTGTIFLHKTLGKCIIKQEDEKSLVLQFEDGSIRTFNKKTLVKNTLLTKTP